ncbi:MAG TPA: hypothetical protein VIJ14_06010 [Rhabdochlamydiaceae bacterium]
MSPVTPPGYLSRLASWGSECLQSQVTQLKAPLLSSFPSWDALFDLANRVKYLALAAIVLVVLYNQLSASPKTPPPSGTPSTTSTATAGPTFTQTVNGRSINYSCDQDVVSFSTAFSKEYISQLKGEGYNGFNGKVNEAEWNKLVEEQNYVEILKIIWTENDLDVALLYLEPDAKKGHAILMLEMSRTLCRKMRAENKFPIETIKAAGTWYLRGLYTTMLDVVCNTDKSSGAAIGMLQTSYTPGNLIPEAQLKKVDFASVNTSFRQNWELQTSSPSPKWVTYHGMAVFRKENSLLPEAEWNAKRAAKFQEIKSAQ